MQPRDKPPGLGERLAGTLTAGQVQALLDVLVRELDAATVQRLRETLGSDIVATILGELERENPPGTHEVPAPQPATSPGEEWAALWSRWNETVLNISNLCHPCSPYVSRQAPFFDRSALAGDLEAVAESMWALVTSGNPFQEPPPVVQMLEDVESALQAIPEWLDPERSPLRLLPATTRLLLHWQWQVDGVHGGERWLESVVAMKASRRRVRMDDGAFWDYLADMPEHHLRSVLQALRVHPDAGILLGQCGLPPGSELF